MCSSDLQVQDELAFLGDNGMSGVIAALIAGDDISVFSQQIDDTSALTLALGKDIAGHPVVIDLAKTPHLLVAGTTGSGKSVGINAMILSMLFRNSPKRLRLVLIDPKMLEFSLYNDIPHLLTPVVTDRKSVV